MLFQTTHMHDYLKGFYESKYLEAHSIESLDLSEKEISLMENISILPIQEEVLKEFKISIPMAYARGESSKRVSLDEVEDIPHYEIYVERQVGTSRNRRDTYLYLKLPKSGMLVTIILYMDGGVGFDPKFHKYIIRELDALDRRVILGFCLYNEYSLLTACYREEDHIWNKDLIRKGLDYKVSMMPKRLKTGSRGNDFTRAYSNLEPYEEFGIFSNVAII